MRFASWVKVTDDSGVRGGHGGFGLFSDILPKVLPNPFSKSWLALTVPGANDAAKVSHTGWAWGGFETTQRGLAPPWLFGGSRARAGAQRARARRPALSAGKVTLGVETDMPAVPLPGSRHGQGQPAFAECVRVFVSGNNSNKLLD